MWRKRVILLILTVCFCCLSLPNLFSLSCVFSIPRSTVTFEIDRVQVIEDRDFGSGEIYLKVTIGTGSPIFSGIYQGINDGNNLQLDWMIYNGETESLTVLVEVWESDQEYDETENDYLGQASVSWDCQAGLSAWYNCEGAIGGNNQLQARVYIVGEITAVTTIATTTTTIETTIETTEEPTTETTIVTTEPSLTTQETREESGTILSLDTIIGLGVIFLAIVMLISIAYLISRSRRTPRPSYSQIKARDDLKPLRQASVSVTLGQPFFCQLCGEKHPTGHPRIQCASCARMICVDSYSEMLEVGRQTCPMCGGDLRSIG